MCEIVAGKGKNKRKPEHEHEIDWGLDVTTACTFVALPSARPRRIPCTLRYYFNAVTVATEMVVAAQRGGLVKKATKRLNSAVCSRQNAW